MWYIKSNKTTTFRCHGGIMKKGFTISELLITIAIIGVIISMTMPSFIKNYKRKTVETKLEKFYTVINQAVMMSIAEHGEILIENENRTNSNNSEYIEYWYKNNITKYIKIIHEEGADKNREYYKVAFIDGSGFNSYMSRSIETTGKSNLYIFFCVNYSKCQLGNYDGVNQFLFVYSPTRQAVIPCFSGSSISYLKNGCYSSDIKNRHGCAAIIEAYGWKIPKDYPWIK